MKCFDIDLYEYYNVSKPQGGQGILTCYIHDDFLDHVSPISPAMLVIAGGGYAFCSKREKEPVCMKYLGYGFQCFALEYSVSPIKHPYQITEAIMAMNYIRENADKFNIDKNKVSAVGFSAGGHLCAMLGSYYNNEESKKIFNGKENARPDAIILSYAVITYGDKAHLGSFNCLCGDDEELKKKLDISNLVNKNSAPAFIWATRNDGTVPVKNSLVVASAYENFDLPFSLHIFGKGVHGSSIVDRCVEQNYGYENTSSKKLGEWVSLSVDWIREQNLFFDKNE